VKISHQMKRSLFILKCDVHQMALISIIQNRIVFYLVAFIPYDAKREDARSRQGLPMCQDVPHAWWEGLHYPYGTAPKAGIRLLSREALLGRQRQGVDRGAIFRI